MTGLDRKEKQGEGREALGWRDLSRARREVLRGPQAPQSVFVHAGTLVCPQAPQLAWASMECEMSEGNCAAEGTWSPARALIC